MEVSSDKAILNVWKEGITRLERAASRTPARVDRPLTDSLASAKTTEVVTPSSSPDRPLLPVAQAVGRMERNAPAQEGGMLAFLQKIGNAIQAQRNLEREVEEQQQQEIKEAGAHAFERKKVTDLLNEMLNSKHPGRKKKELRRKLRNQFGLHVKNGKKLMKLIKKWDRMGLSPQTMQAILSRAGESKEGKDKKILRGKDLDRLDKTADHILIEMEGIPPNTEEFAKAREVAIGLMLTVSAMIAYDVSEKEYKNKNEEFFGFILPMISTSFSQLENNPNISTSDLFRTQMLESAISFIGSHGGSTMRAYRGSTTRRFEDTTQSEAALDVVATDMLTVTDEELPSQGIDPLEYFGSLFALIGETDEAEPAGLITDTWS